MRVAAIAASGIILLILAGTRQSEAQGTLELISVATDGGAAGATRVLDMTPDGRYVVFWSSSTDLVDGETNDCGSSQVECPDLYIRDRLNGVIERVNVDSEGNEANDYGETSASISPDGRFVVFSSPASNLVAGDFNGQTDVFLRDRAVGTTERVSIGDLEGEADGGSGGAVVSADGRFVAFGSSAAHLVKDDNNDVGDVFVRDREMGTTTRVSVNTEEDEAAAESVLEDMTPDGRFVVLSSFATNLAQTESEGCEDYIGNPAQACMHIFLRDTEQGVTTPISIKDGAVEGNRDSSRASISDDGRFVAFLSRATNLVPGDTSECIVIPGDKFTTNCQDVFVRDRQAGVTTKVSVNSLGEQAASGSIASQISGDGRFVAFSSSAANLVEDPTTVTCGYFACGNVFLHDVKSGNTIEASPGTQGDAFEALVAMNGNTVAFSTATPEVAGDENGDYDVYVYALGDGDGDGELDPFDNCPSVPNAGQDDGDHDGIGDACDNCPHVFEIDQTDSDGDAVGNRCDNCPNDPNVDQADTDSDEMGDGCDPDDDGDGVADGSDNCPLTMNSQQQNVDGDSQGNACDNCPNVTNVDQDDADSDLAGDACDAPGTGNSDCNGVIDATDALALLRHTAGLAVMQSEPCADIGTHLPGGSVLGDVNCSSVVNSVDALLILRANAALPTNLPAGCPAIKPD